LIAGPVLAIISGTALLLAAAFPIARAGIAVLLLLAFARKLGILVAFLLLSALAGVSRALAIHHAKLVLA
jgi:hypothetical protein